MGVNYELVDGVEKLESALAQVRQAQRQYASYTQEQVDKIFKAAAIAANQQRIPLAKLAVAETGSISAQMLSTSPSERTR